MKICIVCVDCLRPDHLGCYGYHKKTSPNIDSIAKDSILYQNVTAQSKWTYPSFYSLFTGRYPSVLQTVWFDQRINERFVVLPELLSGRGYHTALYSNLKILLNQEGFGGHFNERRHILLDNEPVGAIDRFFKERENCFLLFHTAEYIHEPYCADESYVSLFLDEDIDKNTKSMSRPVEILTARNSTGNTLRNIIGKINKRILRISSSEIRYLLACYDAGIYYVDKLVGEIYHNLRKLGEDYMFILMADHGQAFMEHNVFCHGYHVYDEIVKVPLIIDFNGSHRARIPNVIQLMDTFPTILDLLGINIDFKINAFSTLPLLSMSDTTERIAVSEGYPFISIKDDNFKLITAYTKFENYKSLLEKLYKHQIMNSWKKNLVAKLYRFLGDRLYDLENDKEERVNVRLKNRVNHEKLRNRLKDILNEAERDRLASDDVDYDYEMKRQLEGLGYL